MYKIYSTETVTMELFLSPATRFFFLFFFTLFLSGGVFLLTVGVEASCLFGFRSALKCLLAGLKGCL